MLKFPDGFVWGASISAHQSEGNNHNNWSLWEHKTADMLAQKAQKKYGHLSSWPRIKEFALESHNYISANAADHFHRYEEDFDLAKEIGIKSLRVSIEWSRIQPLEDTIDDEAMEHYFKYIKALIDRGIEPVITIWHWTLPIWVEEKGGWLNPKIADYFLEFVRFIATLPGVTKYVILNEPEIYSREAFIVGRWPPGSRNLFKFRAAVNNFVEVHKKIHDLLKELNPNAQIGIAKNNTYFEPLNNRLINNIAARPLNHWGNHHLLNRLIDHLDFIGVNFYFHQFVNVWREQEPSSVFSDMGWELNAYGMYFILRELKRYNKPIYITENGLADMDDQIRADYIKDVLHYVLHSIEEGIDIRGYYHWSLTDNFEWSQGFWPKFGLVAINYDTQERHIKNSGWFYRDIIKNNGFESDRYKLPELANL